MELSPNSLRAQGTEQSNSKKKKRHLNYNSEERSECVQLGSVTLTNSIQDTPVYTTALLKSVESESVE